MLLPSKPRSFYNQNCNRYPKHVLTQKPRRQAYMIGGDVLCPRQSVIKKVVWTYSVCIVSCSLIEYAASYYTVMYGIAQNV